MRRLLLLSRLFAITFLLGGTYAHAKKVAIEWKSMEGAIRYEIHFQGKGIQTPNKTVEGLKWKGDLANGIYAYQVRAIDAIGRPGFWTELQPLVVLPKSPKPKFPIDGKKLLFYTSYRPISLKWEKLPTAREYRVELKQGEKVLRQEIVKGNELQFTGLPPGSYSWTVAAILEPARDSPSFLAEKKWETQPSSAEKFKIVQAELEAPRLLFPVGSEDFPENRKLTFEWKEVEGASAYEIQFAELRSADPEQSLRSAKKMRTSNTSLIARVSKQGSYVWKVRAFAGVAEKDIEQKGPPAVAQFTLSLKSEDFYKDLGFLALSGMFAPYGYRITSPSNGFSARTGAAAGAGRVSGELWPFSRWGISASGDLAFFNLSRQDFTRTSLDFHVKFRTSIGNGRYGWFIAPKVGAELRTYPQIVPNDLINLRGGFHSSDITAVGLSVGLDVRKQFGDRWSLGVKYSYFLPLLLDGPSASASQIVGNESYRNMNVGIQAIYWLSSHIGFGAGAYLDQRSIKFVPSGAQSEEKISMDGAYFFGSFIYRFWK